MGGPFHSIWSLSILMERTYCRKVPFSVGGEMYLWTLRHTDYFDDRSYYRTTHDDEVELNI